MSAFIDKLKNAYKSATIWFNTVVGGLISLVPTIKDTMPDIQGYLPAKLYMYLAVILFVGNIILRFKTDADLRDK